EDRAPTPLATQIHVQAAIARLSVLGKIARPDARFHPFVAYDPRREVESRRASALARSGPPPSIGTHSSALEMVRYAIESAGFVGVQVSPPVGSAAADNARLRPSETLSPRLDLALASLYQYCEAEEVPITAHASVANEFSLGTRKLVAPDRWAPALASHPGLRL